MIECVRNIFCVKMNCDLVFKTDLFEKREYLNLGNEKGSGHSTNNHLADTLYIYMVIQSSNLNNLLSCDQINPLAIWNFSFLSFVNKLLTQRAPLYLVFKLFRLV